MGSQVSCFEPGDSAGYLHAAVDGDAGYVRACLATRPLLALHRGVGGLRDSAWHLAAAYGHADVLQELYTAVVNNRVAVTQRLRTKAHDDTLTEEQAVSHAVNVLNIKGQTPLMFACFAGKPDCARALMKMVCGPTARRDVTGEHNMGPKKTKCPSLCRVYNQLAGSRPLDSGPLRRPHRAALRCAACGSRHCTGAAAGGGPQRNDHPHGHTHGHVSVLQ